MVTIPGSRDILAALAARAFTTIMQKSVSPNIPSYDFVLHVICYTHTSLDCPFSSPFIELKLVVLISAILSQSMECR